MGFNEHINEESLSNLGEEIKSMFQNNLNQDQINKVLNHAKGTLGSDDKTGKVSELIQCLQNDINDPTCFEMDGNTSAHSTAFSIQGTQFIVTAMCALFVLFLINMMFVRKL